MRLGNEIRNARRARGWSQRQLALAAGVSRPTVARIEADQDVSTVTLNKVAHALGGQVQLGANEVQTPEDTDKAL